MHFPVSGLVFEHHLTFDANTAAVVVGYDQGEKTVVCLSLTVESWIYDAVAADVVDVIAAVGESVVVV